MLFELASLQGSFDSALLVTCRDMFLPLLRYDDCVYGGGKGMGVVWCAWEEVINGEERTGTGERNVVPSLRHRGSGG
jgi:hypothetical protein